MPAVLDRQVDAFNRWAVRRVIEAEHPVAIDPAIKAAQSNLLDFTQYTKSDYEVNWHHRVLASYLDRFVAGEIKRLMVFQPPRTGKSELVSRRLPAYIMGRLPDTSIIACSYGADLSQRMNRDVQRIMDSSAYQKLFPDTRLYGANVRTVAQGTWLRNSDIFEVVGHKGVYRSAGVGGGITGQGAEWAIVDDPVKNQEEADSTTYRNAVWEWYTSTFYTRLEKNGSILITLTRWHQDDLAGRLLELARTDPNADQWTVIRFPAVGEPDNAIPEDTREAGEPLWPNKFDAATLATMRATVGSRQWASLYQQRPTLTEGAIWKRELWRYYEQAPRCRLIVQAWDTAFQEKQSADYSVCTTWGLGEHGIYLLDRTRARLEFPQLVTAAKAAYERWTPNVQLIEDAASGQSLVQVLRQTTSLPIVAVKVDKSKQARAWAVAPMVEAGRVFLPAHAPWLDEYLREMDAFPAGTFDDQVDSTTLALNYLRNFVGDRLTADSDVVRPDVEATEYTRPSAEITRGTDLSPWSGSRFKRGRR